ncbi:hypothetical protein H9P43_002810 [Blastocladiella emersonii ATCC 22665]|nr:hypothetical protein H9P43_002810 [Blastocladiella emersonii ATCC 22665]
MPIQVDVTLAGDEVRTFFRILQSLNKIGTDLFIEVDETKFQLSTLNPSKSAFALVSILPLFFRSFHTADLPPAPPTAQQSQAGGNPALPRLQCRLPLAPLFAIFKGKHAAIGAKGANGIEGCRLAIGTHIDFGAASPTSAAADADPEGSDLDAAQPHFAVQFTSPANQGGTRMTFRLHLTSPTVVLHPVYTKAACPNVWTALPDQLAGMVAHFHPRVDDIVLRCAPRVVTWRTAPPDAAETDRSAGSALALATVVEMAADDMDPYVVEFAGDNEAVEVCFGWREFKAALRLAEHVGEPVSAHFGKPGSAIIFSLHKADQFMLDLVLATVLDESAYVPPAPAVQQAAARVQPRNSGPPAPQPQPQQQQQRVARPPTGSMSDPFALPGMPAQRLTRKSTDASTTSSTMTIPSVVPGTQASSRAGSDAGGPSGSAAAQQQQMPPPPPRRPTVNEDHSPAVHHQQHRQFQHHPGFPFASQHSPSALHRHESGGAWVAPTLGESVTQMSATSAGGGGGDSDPTAAAAGAGANSRGASFSSSLGGVSSGSSEMPATLARKRTWAEAQQHAAAARLAVVPEAPARDDEEDSDEEVPGTPPPEDTPVSKRTRRLL